ncbi:hypothetical protein OCK74_14505 [Chitinophagaceae bacterium LB-8]|jgi:hypothetical protein|uniref:Uncharacterized protein n=1 Tax=Paraflavisolibacter caeni TaxID=2982496 RepID=A0A9X2XWT3_9BACT|nr:hypothetical protein [Paraflavisolibacter caeni]MCU7550330.1 hypothetical protein [Paraflavisolibacter caeni]
MNTHFSLRTDGFYLRKMPDNTSYSFIKLFIEEPGNDHANNYLLKGTVKGSLKEVLDVMEENGEMNAEHISFHIDDNDETEIYWYADNGWHFMITVQNEGRSIILTSTHPQHKRISTEYEFHPTSV